LITKKARKKRVWIFEDKLFEERKEGSINYGTEKYGIWYRPHICSFGDLTNRRIYNHLHTFVDILLTKKKLYI
jgi:hypothetical protein